MKNIVYAMLCIVFVLGYAEEAPDQYVNQEIIYRQEAPQIQTIIQRLDQAKQDGNMALFDDMLGQYRDLNPPYIPEDAPQGMQRGPEPKEGQGSLIDWGTDVLIDSAWEFPSISMDTRSDGYIFVAAEKDSTSSSTRNIIPIWYTTDGSSWTYYYDIWWVGRDCRNPSCQVVQTSGSDWLYVMFDGIQTNSPYDIDVWVLTHEFGTSVWTYYPVSEVVGVDEADPSMDADDYQYTSGVYLYCAFESEDSIVFMRSLDLGATWIDRQVLGNGDPTWDYVDPELAYGWYASADSFSIGVAWQIKWDSPQQSDVRFRRNRLYGAPGSWLGTTYFTAPADDDDLRAKVKMTHGTMPSGTIVFSRYNTVTNEQNLCNYYTYNGGRTWTNDTLYYGGDYEVLTALANDQAANDYHAFFRGDNDDIRYKEAHYDDFSYDGWSYSIGISDPGQSMSSYTDPAAAELNNDPCVVWKDISNGTWYKLLFDALWWTSVEEIPGATPVGLVSLTPTISSGPVKLSYVLRSTGHVRISLYDASGRLVRNITNERQETGEHTLSLNNSDLAAGVYFISVETPEHTESAKLIIAR